MIRVGIHGGSGRVGNMLIDALSSAKDLALACVYVRSRVNFTATQDVLVTNSLEEFLKHSDVVVDFTSPGGTQNLLAKAIEFKPTSLVVGTTGLGADLMGLLNEAAQKMPVFYATNMSLGVAVLNRLVFEASKILRDFDAEIYEMHHRHKKDAPSGTALTLAKSVAAARGLDLDAVRVSARDGITGERTKDEIAVMSFRGGDIVGEHTVGFYSSGEFLRLSHTATDRKTFALGALKAAAWLSSKKNGLYSIKDLLQFE